MNLLNVVTSALTSGPALEALSAKTGLSKKQLALIISVAVPILMKKMTSNASSNEGAASLLGALGQHKTNKAIEKQLGEADVEDGAKIVGHSLGNDKAAAVKHVAKEAGASEADVAQVLGNISPSLLSSLSAATASASNQKQSGVDLSDGFDMKDVMGLLGMAQGKTSSGAGGGGGGMGDLLGSFLGGAQKPSKQEDGTELLQSLLGMMK